MWIWTSRPGFEGDLVEELGGATRAGPSLVSSPAAPARWPTFARAGFPLAAEVAPAEAAAAVARVVEGLPKRPWLLQAWVPDSDETNPLAATATALGESVAAEVARARPDLELRRVPKAGDAVRYGGVLVQLCVVAPSRSRAER